MRREQIRDNRLNQFMVSAHFVVFFNQQTRAENRICEFSVKFNETL